MCHAFKTVNYTMNYQFRDICDTNQCQVTTISCSIPESAVQRVEVCVLVIMNPQNQVPTQRQSEIFIFLLMSFPLHYY